MAEVDLVGAKEEALDQGSQGKCTKQFAQSAEKNAKFLSSQQKASQYIAKNATEAKGSTKLIILKKSQ